jgi:hypothetical protein
VAVVVAVTRERLARKQKVVEVEAQRGKPYFSHFLRLLVTPSLSPWDLAGWVAVVEPRLRRARQAVLQP